MTTTPARFCAHADVDGEAARCTCTPALPTPAGAVKAEWQDPGTPGVYRYFEGERRIIDTDQAEGIEVYVAGTQEPDGSIKPEVVVGVLHPDDPITPAQARQLARALIAAADDSERCQA